MYRDNKSLLYNTKLPVSKFNKKGNSIAYHAVTEGVVTGDWLTRYEPTDKYLSDLLTNTSPGGKRRTRLVRGVTYYI